MKRTLQKIALAMLVIGSVAASASPSFARENEHRWEGRDRFSERRDLRQDYQNLADWRNKLQYDASHHASRKKLAEDDNAIQQLEAGIHRDRRELGNERR